MFALGKTAVFTGIAAGFLLLFLLVSGSFGPLSGCSPVHWHPKLKIVVEGKEQAIPTNIGITRGVVIDTDLSGMRMSPTHTHSLDGVIHMENNCPDKRPETYTLGYFFKVWDKTFNSTCILEYCNDGVRRVGMKVNGEEKNEFENYKMKDLDEMIISYA